jgi:hypothetical protein
VLALNITLKRLDLGYNSVGVVGARAIGQGLTVNTTLTVLDPDYNHANMTLTTPGHSNQGRGVRAIAEELTLNKALTELSFACNEIGDKGAAAIARAVNVNMTLTTLGLHNNRIQAKGATKIAKALQVNHVLTTLHLYNPGCGYHFDKNELDKGLLIEIDRLLTVNMALDTKLLAVMMSTHARPGAGNGLRVLNESLVTMICDVFRRKSKTSSLLDEGDVEEQEEPDSGSESNEEEEDEDGDDALMERRHRISLGLRRLLI